MNEGISFEDYLSENDSLPDSNKGVSMLPLLREGKDLFTVAKKGSNRCIPKEYDVQDKDKHRTDTVS